METTPCQAIPRSLIPCSLRQLRTDQRRSLAADALIASTYLSRMNTRRVCWALEALFRGAISKDKIAEASVR